tara:strand:+ start:2371 stop:3342 length:972 start_codon:yes stop_codon:yes gene_type:complete
MSVSEGNYRLVCQYCKEDFLTKNYSKHLIDKHKSEIFVNKANKDELSGVANKPETWWPRPIEINLKGKIQYYVPCCKQFYTKETLAMNHSKSKECRELFVKKAKELLLDVSPVTINNSTVSGSIVNNITQNITIVDLSGNVLKTIKQLVNTIDYKEQERATYRKKLEKLRAKYKDDPEYDSDISTVASYYGDDESDDYESKMERYLPEEQISKNVVKSFNKFGIDISREGLELRTKQDHDRETAEKREFIIEELQVEYDTVVFAIKNIQDDIIYNEKKISDPDFDDSWKVKARINVHSLKSKLEDAKKMKEEVRVKLEKAKTV